MKRISFGARVAEEETGELGTYFVETDQWERIFNGEIDIVKGDKGAGKSAIYSLLSAKSDELFDKRILVITAEEPRGTPVFKELVTDPPAAEAEFIGLWKLYLLSLVAKKFQEFGINNEPAIQLIDHLSDQSLIPPAFDLRKLLKAVRQYAHRYFSPTVEATVKIEPTGAHVFTGKITPGEPRADETKAGYVSVDSLASLAEQALKEADFQIWVLLDRLDVAFAETHDLEKNALRALFRVYRDFSAYDHIKLKIFLRTDIWSRIVESGFREASHITRDITLTWSKNALLNLIIKRVVKNAALVEAENIDRDAVLRSFPAQTELFHKLFPEQVDQGAKKPSTLDWIISRCADASDKTAPREVIHLLNSIREQEVARLELGEEPPPEPQLFDRSVFKLALPAVSQAKLVSNLYAEYPELKPTIQELRGEKTEQTLETLAKLFGQSLDEAAESAESLVSIGFFQKRGSRDNPTFWVPFLYRDELQMVQGLADD
ncbi:hypothetical protein Q2941_18450 [Bradyrhizobium sp. UFLA05-153]